MHSTLIKHFLNCLFFEGSMCEGTIFNNKNEEDQDSNNAKKGRKKKMKESEALFEITLVRPTEKYLTIKQL